MRHCWILTLLFLVIVPVSAQPEWTVVERCIEQTSIPQHWSYTGTILLRGQDGLYGINVDWDTPQLVANLPPRYDTLGEALSPDNKWYATLQGETFYSDSNNHLYEVHEIVVYSTTNPDEVYRIPWLNGWMNNWGQSRAIHWLDNQHLVYEYYENIFDVSDETDGAYIINPFTGEQSRWEGQYDIFYNSPTNFVDHQYQHVSPDLTLSLVTHLYGANSTKWTTLYNVQTGEEIARIDNLIDMIVWLPDTSGFAGVIEHDENDRRIAWFNSQGELQQELLPLASARIPIPYGLVASPDSRYVAFATSEYEELHQRSIRLLYLVDFAQHEVIYTCIESGHGLAWSPDSRQLAFTQAGRRTAEVRILDTESWTMETVGEHVVEDAWHDIIIGWREDD